MVTSYHLTIVMKYILKIIHRKISEISLISQFVMDIFK